MGPVYCCVWDLVLGSGNLRPSINHYSLGLLEDVFPTTTAPACLSDMKIAITADIHLHVDHPERLNALRNILDQIRGRGVRYLFIAGDLFDQNNEASSRNLFEELCREYPKISVNVIPGNHDLDLRQDNFAYENIRVYDHPTAFNCGSRALLLSPYASGSMASALTGAKALRQVKGKEWILLGHGDYISGLREPNPHEPGVYMPLSRSDKDKLGPRRVILGHIHKPTPLDAPLDGDVIYVGSPCAVDRSETGKRRYLIYNDEARDPTHLFEEVEIQAEVLHFEETFYVYPSANEVSELKENVRNRIDSWKLREEQLGTVRLKAELIGAALDRKALCNSLGDVFKAVRLLDDVDYKDLLSLTGPGPEEADLLSLVYDAMKQADALQNGNSNGVEKSRQWCFDENEPPIEQVKQEIMKLICEAR